MAKEVSSINQPGVEEACLKEKRILEYLEKNHYYALLWEDRTIFAGRLVVLTIE